MAKVPTTVSIVLDWVVPLILDYLAGLRTDKRPSFLAAVLPIVEQMVADADEKHLGHIPFAFRAKYLSVMEDVYSTIETGAP